ncbi:Site-specific recombinases [Nitrospira japonica]|uniref:Site-specific recombinases n=1 Tax=Nitrospira japonica TaxID=1325564 RepID=A0A1W1I6F6_9BACT|nr:recombinase family protein [Nitrospira japonica]SLM48423.1 Site-specific recombinases [Nitrospira japonica]
MTRVALYARYSSEGQREASIEDQFRNCEQYSQRENQWTVIYRYFDKAISGATHHRESYQQMLKDAQAACFDVLLVDDLSRLSRDQVETEMVRRRLVYWGIRLIGVSDGIDTAKRGHKVIANFKGMMNEVFLDDLRDKTRRGMVGQVLKGYHGGGRIFGYRLVPQLHPTQRDPYGQPIRVGTRLEIDEAQARWVKWIFEQYADGMSPVKIVEELNRRNVPPPGIAYRRRSTRSPSWCASALYGNVKYGLGMLNNRLYKGEMVWGRSRWEKDPDTKKKRRFLCDERDWIKHKDENLRIVDDQLWECVKQRQESVHDASLAIREKLHANARTGRGPKYLFSGLLTCGQCGYRFVIIDPSRYGCSGWKYRGLSVCTNTIMASRKLIEKILLESIKHDLFTPERIAVFTREASMLLAKRQHEQNLVQNRQPVRLSQVEQEIENLLAAIKAGIVTPRTKHELEKAEAEREVLIRASELGRQRSEEIASFLPNAVDRFKTLLDDLAGALQVHVDRARGILRVLLGEKILLHPTSNGVERFLTAEISGNYAGLVRLATGKNKFGGGQGS